MSIMLMSRLVPSMVSISIPQYICLVTFKETLVGAADETLAAITNNKSPVAGMKELLQLVPSEMLVDKAMIASLLTIFE